MVVNGDNVLITGLFVEHFQEYNTVWNGEGGRVYLYQNELPYEPARQEEWMASGETRGWAGYKVNNTVTTHELWAGVYCYNRNNPDIVTDNGFEVPVTPGVKLSHIMAKNLSGPGVIESVVNGLGDQVDSTNDDPSYVISYPAN